MRTIMVLLARLHASPCSSAGEILLDQQAGGKREMKCAHCGWIGLALLICGCATRAIQPVAVALRLDVSAKAAPVVNATPYVERQPVVYYQTLAILCASEVTRNTVWQRWADAWLSGKDRSRETAKEAWYAFPRRSGPAAYAAISCAATAPNAVFVNAFQCMAESVKVKPLDIARLEREAREVK